jgi:hypothetical protein
MSENRLDGDLPLAFIGRGLGFGSGIWLSDGLCSNFALHLLGKGVDFFEEVLNVE